MFWGMSMAIKPHFVEKRLRNTMKRQVKLNFHKEDFFIIIKSTLFISFAILLILIHRLGLFALFLQFLSFLGLCLLANQSA